MRNRLGILDYGVGFPQNGVSRIHLSYGRIFLVTFSKPVQRKSAEDNPVATPEREAVWIDARQWASMSWR